MEIVKHISSAVCTVFYNLKDPLIKGKHKIEISVSDNSDNTKKISGVFYIK